jgi:CRISPR-associated endonuclease/helicase Cas3
MRPSRWPDHLDYLLAKSVAQGGETLAQHTWDVLSRLADLRHLRPTLALLAETPQLWHCLFWTCLLHDFGKAARGFQGMLRGNGPWKHRHEVLSLAFLDWIAAALRPEEQRWIVAAIVSHHRDAADIQRLYADTTPDPLALLAGELEPITVHGLWRWIDGCAADWIAALGFPPDEVRPLPLIPQEQAVALVLQQGVQRVRHWLRQYEAWVDELGHPVPMRQRLPPILLRGLTTSADHMASAHLKRLPAPLQESWQNLAARILKPGQTSYRHQEQSAALSGRSVILVAPTGSGKTEAALYWALGDGTQPVPRLFYALPYQASMNAMFDRLKDPLKGFGENAVGLQHGRAMQALYARLIDQESRPATAAARAAWEKNINTLNARPLKVFSPYQMLKAAFQLRGFEAMLTDYAQAAFVFDEIHAYEPGRLALILALARYLREGYGARFFIMSATFPQIIRDKLADALGSYHTITADDAVFRAFRRHRLQLLDGELTTAGIERIVGDVRAGKRVLVCANTVRRAQTVRDTLLQAGLARDQVLLIHSRYITRDRTERERAIMKRCGIGVQGAPLVLVATQVVEVSLNIDLDTIYTDPAPLEALLQRFGRVNRACAKGLCPVYVFRLPADGQYVYGRHKDPQRRGHIVRVTLAELERHNEQEIDEAQINDWLDRIYSDLVLRAEWEAEYQRLAQNAALVLANMQPFNSDPQKEEEFEQLFDTVEVLPECFEQQYLDCLKKEEFIEASRYFVGISTRKYAELARKGLVRPADHPEGRRRKWVVRLPYDVEMGLSFDERSSDPDWD